ncbi:MAG TPA: Crp/Fnr family transcriptional regulator [Mycobacteriales bacterium]|nr:Crp/Fnr family transcriptional regulator [Mycobacteriales bacterium]
MSIPFEHIASFPLLTTLSEDDGAALAVQLVPLAASRGERIFTEGDTGDAVYLVLNGKIKISREAGDGRENLLMVMGPGDMFGELSLFDPGPRTATASAVVDTQMASLTHAGLQSWIEERPGGAMVVLQVLARRLRNTNDALSDLVFTDVPGRVAKALLGMAEKFGQPRDDGALTLQHGLTQEELAQLVGASRETVNKALADFATRGWLRLESRGVVILDQDRLEHRAR